MKRMKLNFNNKSTWFMVLSLVCAAILAIQVTKTVNKAKNEIEVVQTTVNIPPYTVIKPDMVKVVKVPAASVIEGTFLKQDLSSVVGKYTGIGLLPSTNVQKGHIIPYQDATITALLYSLKNQSLVAASVPLTANDVGSQIHPGDVIHLNGVFNMQANQVISKYVAEYVSVLGIDKKEDGTARMYVAVKKENFPEIARSIDTGRIRAAVAQKGYEAEEKAKAPVVQPDAAAPTTEKKAEDQTTKQEGGKKE
ncbi:SAF domain-containing protein [Aneurinibacillus aneurinilyticus]|jgi:Flp pilus assembly protein CpaB|uniref:SAF domain-containing protein n=1 Tax=Aneurinibacillus aneurinilyticus TaxID=1391 RepID=UPI0023F588F6|nr:SAF domain-containing protein [Aneurinibacillus aneurinilyticus]